MGEHALLIVGLVGGLLAMINIAMAGGFLLGRMGQKVDAAHHRISSLEENLCKRLEQTLEQAWRFCPLAASKPHTGKEK